MKIKLLLDDGKPKTAATRETPHINIDCNVERHMLRSMTLEQKRHGPMMDDNDA